MGDRRDPRRESRGTGLRTGPRLCPSERRRRSPVRASPARTLAQARDGIRRLRRVPAGLGARVGGRQGGARRRRRRGRRRSLAGGVVAPPAPPHPRRRPAPRATRRRIRCHHVQSLRGGPGGDPPAAHLGLRRTRARAGHARTPAAAGEVGRDPDLPREPDPPLLGRHSQPQGDHPRQEPASARGGAPPPRVARRSRARVARRLRRDRTRRGLRVTRLGHAAARPPVGHPRDVRPGRCRAPGRASGRRPRPARDPRRRRLGAHPRLPRADARGRGAARPVARDVRGRSDPPTGGRRRARTRRRDLRTGHPRGLRRTRPRTRGRTSHPSLHRRGSQPVGRASDRFHLLRPAGDPGKPFRGRSHPRPARVQRAPA